MNKFLLERDYLVAITLTAGLSTRGLHLVDYWNVFNWRKKWGGLSLGSIRS